MKREEWFKRYKLYLRTPEWKDKRERVLRRCGYICEACGQNQALHVHHTSYRYGRHTPLWDLRGVCRDCHETLTALDRGELKPWNWEQIDELETPL